MLVAVAMIFCFSIPVFAENTDSTVPQIIGASRGVLSVNGNIYGSGSAYINDEGSFYVHCTGSSSLGDIRVTAVSSNSPNTIVIVIYRPDGGYLFQNQALTYTNKQNQNHYTATNLSEGDYKVYVYNYNGGCAVTVSIEDYYVVHG